MKKQTKILLAVAILIVLAGGMFLLYRQFAPKAAAGDKHITLSIVYDDGTQKDHELDTDVDYLLQALESVATIEGVSSAEYGYTLYTIDGVTADFNVDSSYWAIYVNDDYGMYNISDQPIEDGGTYTIAYERY